MLELFTWLYLLTPPVLIIAVTIYVFRPSARDDYNEASQVIFEEPDNAPRAPRPADHDHSLKA